MERETTSALLTSFNAEKLQVKIYDSRMSMGIAAATDVAEKIRSLHNARSGFVNIIFAAAPSQNEFLSQLTAEPGIDWSRINGFHMDEYVGIEQSASQSFAYFLKKSLFEKVPFNHVYYLNGKANNITDECGRYARLLEAYPADIVCMGIGENTHIAFNDPHTANFKDPVLVKEVTLDSASRQQQVNDGCFPTLEDVPVAAITLTVPALLRTPSVYCMVPGKNKARAIYQTINNDPTERFPSTSLKEHDAATLYLDADSASEI